MNSANDRDGACSGTTDTMQALASSSERRFGAPLANRSHRGGRGVRVHCPHCLALAKTRGSEALTPLCREFRYQCTNVDGDEPCGHTFVAVMEIRRTIVPSARPNPRVNLPISPPRAARTPKDVPNVAANDDAPSGTQA